MKTTILGLVLPISILELKLPPSGREGSSPTRYTAFGTADHANFIARRRLRAPRRRREGWWRGQRHGPGLVEREVAKPRGGVEPRIVLLRLPAQSQTKRAEIRDLPVPRRQVLGKVRRGFGMLATGFHEEDMADPEYESIR